jgi:tetratricopeptide (TPR) repeat protein
MFNLVSIIALAILGQTTSSQAVWPQLMINELKPKIHRSHSTAYAGKRQTSATVAKSITADPTLVTIIVPGPDPGNAETAVALDRVAELRKEGKLSRATDLLESTLAQFPNASPHYYETVQLADLYFRSDRYSDAYDLLSSYVAEYRDSDEAVSLTNQRFLLLTSLALAHAGQVYPGQRDYLVNLLTRGSCDPEDLPRTNSAHDVAILSYMVLAQDNMTVADARWYLQQAYKFGGPSAYLDLHLAYCTTNPVVGLRYLQEAETMARDTGSVQHEIKGLKYRFEDAVAQRASSAK